MKLKVQLLVLLFLCGNLAAQQTYVPDDALEQKFITLGYDDVLDDYVATASLEGITTLNLGTGVQDTRGIEACIALETLSFSGNSYTSINLSQNINLKYVYLGNSLQSLDVSNLTNLLELTVAGDIETIDLSNNPALKRLSITGNKIEQIDLSTNLLLEELNLQTNQLINIDLSNNVNLERLNLKNNLITTLDLSSNTKLTHINLQNNKLNSLNLSNIDYTKLFSPNIEDNPDLYCVTVSDVDAAFQRFKNYIHKDLQTGFSLDCSATTNVPDAEFEQALIDLGYDSGAIDGKFFTGNVSAVSNLYLGDNNISDLTGIEAFYKLITLTLDNNNLASLDITSLPELTFLSIKDNPTTSIITNNDLLDYLKIDNTNVTSLDLSNNQKLRTAVIENNTSLTSINFGSISSIEELELNDNKLSSLEIQNGIELEILEVENNELTSLIINSCTKLVELKASDNLLTDIDLSSCVNIEEVYLDNNNLGFLNVYSNTKLEDLYCNNNMLTAVDLRNNNLLDSFYAENNQLISLVTKNGNNESPYSLSVTGNPNLTCVEVDDVTWSTDNWDDIDNSVSFSTDCAPSNDDCTNAIPLIVGQTTPGDLDSGSANNNPSCAVGNVIADVWYKVTIPATGEFSIEGLSSGGFSLKFAIYQTCQSATALACGDAISLTNLNPGDTLYLKVWLETGSNKSAKNQDDTSFTITMSESIVLSTEETNAFLSEFTIYPNPTKEMLNVKSSTGKTIDKVILYNILGKKVLSENIEKEEVNINLNNFSNGIYTLKIISGEVTISKKILKR